MAEADFTTITTEESRAGAKACMDALRVVYNLNESGKHGIRFDKQTSMDEWWKGCEIGKAAVLLAAGRQDEYTSGFIAALADYVVFTADGSMPDLDVWKPEAIMSAEEKTNSRAEFDQETFGG
jgi:hypothetical protein